MKHSTKSPLDGKAMFVIDEIRKKIVKNNINSEEMFRELNKS
jgi:hypothetical protein